MNIIAICDQIRTKLINLILFAFKVIASHERNCQAQPQSQLSWAELALILIPPAARPPGQVVNKQEISSTKLAM